MDIRCYETDEGREIELAIGTCFVTITEQGAVRCCPSEESFVFLSDLALWAKSLNFEAMWASHFEGVPHAPSDRTEA